MNKYVNIPFSCRAQGSGIPVAIVGEHTERVFPFPLYPNTSVFSPFSFFCLLKH